LSKENGLFPRLSEDEADSLGEYRHRCPAAGVRGGAGAEPARFDLYAEKESNLPHVSHFR